METAHYNRKLKKRIFRIKKFLPHDQPTICLIWQTPPHRNSLTCFYLKASKTL